MDENILPTTENQIENQIENPTEKKRSWIEAMIEREALPPEMREETVEEFCQKWGVARSTYYYQLSKPENSEKVIELALRYAKRYTSEVLDNLGQRAKNDNKAAELYLKFVLQLAERLEAKGDLIAPLVVKIIKDGENNNTSTISMEGSGE